MKRTATVKRLLGIGDGIVGVENDRQHDVHECTVCGEQFDTMELTCPACDSHLFRTKTVIPNTLLTLLIVATLAGLAVAYNIITGDVPKE